MLDGTVSDLTILDKEQGSFRARIELISGEWIGTEDVRSYACLIDFSGPASSRCSRPGAPRDPAPDMVLLNSRVLVVARPIGLTTSHQGEKRVQLEGIYVRVIK